ncbi:nucleolar protein Nop52 variant [Rhodotorula toruloides]|uniref:Nucleolar protein Nop52 variant n=1 Tax=Rhodotorula toruloides TaxID=5286 RepID=A0A511K8F0_RHOTO|nr:nucleolar protein Nop52 variant [Rhodotorula toruloides]
MSTRSAPTPSASERPAKKIKSDSNKAGASVGQAPPLGKFLASSEKHVRDKAVQSLAKFLSAGQVNRRGPDDEEEPEREKELPVGDLDWDREYEVDKRLSETEMDKLWKGIFFCYWMSDKPLVQQALADTLSRLTLDVRTRYKTRSGRVERFRCALAYLRGFWHAVTREWSGIDRLRMDKFLLLMRRFVFVAFKLLEREGWDARAIKEYNEMLVGPKGPLRVEDPKIPHSLAYHLFDIYLDEIERLASSSDADAAPARTLPLVALLQPMYTTAARAANSTMYSRLIENVFTPLCDALLPPKPEPAAKRRKGVSTLPKPEYPGIVARAVEGEGVEGRAEAEAIGKKVLKALFDEGAKPETDETNRRRIYRFVAERDVELE